MPELLSPFAPVHDWLARALGIGWDGSRLAAPKFAVHFCEPPEREELDLRDGITRYAVLRAAADVVSRYYVSWALGLPFGRLTDDRAGRAAAEIIRRIGPDPEHPQADLPHCIIGVWTNSHTGSGEWARLAFCGDLGLGAGSRICIDRGSAGWTVRLGDHPSGPDGGTAGRLLADAYAMSHGAILLEQICIVDESQS